MIEIVFGDSACGSLKMAQRFGTGEYRSGGIGVIVSHADGSKPTKKEIQAARREAEEKMRLSWENVIPLGGSSADVYGFNLVLSIGDISEDQPGAKREQLLERLYSVYPNDEGRQAAQEIITTVSENIKIVRERVAAGEDIRIWYSNQPDEMCGLYWFMDQMNQWEAHSGQVSKCAAHLSRARGAVESSVTLVMLPEWEDDGKGNIAQKTGWGELAPEEWHRYLPLQKPVSEIFMQYCASHWRKLRTENAPLRAVLNGKLVSAAENLYDDFILREIAAEGEEFHEAMIIGRVLGKYQLGIGDGWIALRIEEMIRAGKLEAVSKAAEDMPVYHRMLKKAH